MPLFLPLEEIEVIHKQERSEAMGLNEHKTYSVICDECNIAESDDFNCQSENSAEESAIEEGFVRTENKWGTAHWLCKKCNAKVNKIEPERPELAWMLPVAPVDPLAAHMPPELKWLL